ncbi:MAG TPA: OadG family protein [Aminivibrio sp.]|nr:OadG family protein [Aminivibrio sp.]
MNPIHEQIEGVGGALTMSIIAFSVVFLVLGGLSGIIYGIKYMATALERKKGGGSGTAPAPVAPAAAVQTVPAAAGGSDKGRLLAVISAAVAAVEGPGARITSVRPSGGAAALAPRGGLEWKRVGIIETLGGLSRDWK